MAAQAAGGDLGGSHFYPPLLPGIILQSLHSLSARARPVALTTAAAPRSVRIVSSPITGRVKANELAPLRSGGDARFLSVAYICLSVTGTGHRVGGGL